MSGPEYVISSMVQVSVVNLVPAKLYLEFIMFLVFILHKYEVESLICEFWED